MPLHALPALSDNYIWLLADDDGRALVVDPGEPGPVLAAAAEGLVPAGILLTHHHDDHIGGVSTLLARWPGLPVLAPVDDRIATATQRVGGGDTAEVAGWRFDVVSVPGHTVSHIAFHGHGHLFCGDALFSLGCGRLFEGSAEDMLGSLDRLAALPGNPLVCCGHEYTVSNAAFARTVDPDNTALRRRSEEATTMRDAGLPTVPSRLADELACNPFLRVDTAPVADAAARWAGAPLAGRVAILAALRGWKDTFRA